VFDRKLLNKHTPVTALHSYYCATAVDLLLPFGCCICLELHCLAEE